MWQRSVWIERRHSNPLEADTRFATQAFPVENIVFEPGVQLDSRVIGRGYELWESVALAPSAGGTQMTVVDSVVATSIFGRLMIAFSRRIMEGDLRARCANLKKLVETATAED